MNIQELITFVTIVQQGSFSKASHKLGYSQSAVTIQIENLESQLKVRLFDRLGKKISLTNKGEIFYEYSVKILNDINEARDALSFDYHLKGQLTIGTIDSICSSIMPPLLERYHQLYPDVSISIVTDSIDGLLHKIKNNDIDLAYLADRVREDHFIKKVIEVKERALFVACPNHPLFNLSSITIDDLLSYPSILTEKDASYREILEHQLSKDHKKIKPLIETNNTDLIIDLVKRHMGYTFLPEYILKDDLKQGFLKEIPVEGYEVKIYRQVIYHKEKWVSQEMKAFFDLLREDNDELKLSIPKDIRVY